jgi:bifunctional DNase/RNase
VLRTMAISKLAVDTSGKSCVVILKEVDGERSISIWIGLLEATCIASELQGVKFSRPMTHDLIKNIIGLTDGKVSRVEVSDLKDNIYYALIYITHKGKEISIDARPSDALALSVRFRAPIFVEEEVIKQIEQIDEAELRNKPELTRKWQKILEELDPEDFGNA